MLHRSSSRRVSRAAGICTSFSGIMPKSEAPIITPGLHSFRFAYFLEELLSGLHFNIALPNSEPSGIS
jgi:hypothetical protein